MNQNKKQLRIYSLFKRRAVPNDCEDVKLEIQQLEEKLKEKESALYQIRRQCLKHKFEPHEKKKIDFMRPELIVSKNKLEHIKKDLELHSMLTGMEVRSYVKDDHCTVVYHMQHDSKTVVQHGLTISLDSGKNEVTKLSLPLGFNYNAVMEEYDKIMTPECLGSVRKALMAYYNRLEQFQKLKSVVLFNAQLFKVMDGSHIEISFQAQSVTDHDEEPINIVLMLDYRVYDIRPKNYSVKETGNTDISDHALNTLDEQCTVFKRKPLDKAFVECFLEGRGPYKLNKQEYLNEQEHQAGTEHKHKKRARQRDYDETFNPDSYQERD